MKFRISWLIMAVAAYYFVTDVLKDIKEGEAFVHWGVEAGVFIAILLALTFEMIYSKKINHQLSSTEIELNSLKGNLAEVVKEQFQKWSLSNSESEIAWLVIKGLSFVEISILRSVNEKTVRAQASAIYRKSNVKNRSEFTASFLDDLLNMQKP